MNFLDLDSFASSLYLQPWKSLPLLIVFPSVAAVFIVFIRPRKGNQTPPTIPGHWLFKNRQILGAPWRAMLIAEKYVPLYGDIIQISEPLKTRVVLNRIDAITEVLEKNVCKVFSVHVKSLTGVYRTGMEHAIGFRNHDEQHKKLRRVIASGLHPAAARSYDDLHNATTAYFLRHVLVRISGDSLAFDNQAGKSVVNKNSHSKALLESIQDSVGRFILHLTFGHISTENDPVLQGQNKLAFLLTSGFATHYWANDFPILRHIPSWFPGSRFKRHAEYMREIRNQTVKETFEPVLDKALRGIAQLSSYTSNLIELKGGRDISEEDKYLVRWTSSAMFGAGATTTTALINSFIFAMCIHPETASKVQAEIDSQVGRDRIPTLSDQNVLPYTDAVLKEVIRCYPVFPLGLDHCAREDIEVRGYRIKKGTIIEGNIWALMHDPLMYPDPFTFNPDRFLKSAPNTDPRRFLFGFGRRVCPGQHVANNSAFTMCAAFMSVFNIAASQETKNKADQCAREPWKMMKPYGPMEPMPSGCTIRPRDNAAIAVLETCKDTAVIA
ncbi:cytochrome P450 family protein [Rhizoctonia solani AG-3 Rhs1AP]|uniref:Cytochrome P450 family protein n=1 Tax=Rhizoctonia solani AG-3 Rhs1AP TaxID=1086054 RepID=X8IZQ3_9AGAM|nr:cytochrome P450 family protein [Rhizoctonia solani AG-3 Rhs1AP]